MDETLREFTHDSRFLRGPGDGVALGLASPTVSGEVMDVLVVLDDLGGDVAVVVSEEILLGGSLRGRGRGARERHASAAAVGNEIRCGWDARDPPTVRSEKGAVAIDIGRCRRGVAIVTGCD